MQNQSDAAVAPADKQTAEAARAVRAATAQFVFAAGVLGVAVIGFCFPDLFTWSAAGFQPRQAIVPLVQLTMLGMGMTLTAADFTRVATTPRAAGLGIACQFAIMPVAGWALGRLFGLPSDVAAGLVLVGACPGGVASNVVTFIAGGNVALSVTMTACSTLLAPLATPLLMQGLAGASIPIDTIGLFRSIMLMILLPVVVGLLVNRFASPLARRLQTVLPAVAMTAICLIIGITVALARDDLAAVASSLVAAAICHNAAGLTLGYLAARVSGLTDRDARTVGIEVGMQNGGMATGLALGVLKSPAAALPAAVFGPWSALAVSVVAAVLGPPVDNAGRSRQQSIVIRTER